MSQVSFKTKLKPNNKQATLFAKHAGTARHAWKWGLDVCLKALENQEKLPTVRVGEAGSRPQSRNLQDCLSSTVRLI